MFKKLLYLSIILVLFISLNSNAIKNYGVVNIEFSDLTDNYAWAKPAVEELAEQGAVGGIAEGIFAPSYSVSKEQLAKMLSLTFDISVPKTSAQSFVDVPAERWSHPYIEATADFFPKNTLYPINEFKPEEACSRQMLAWTVANVLDLKTTDHTYMNENFLDAKDADPDFADYLAAVVNAKILTGSNGLLLPKNNVTRAETAVILKRAKDYKKNGFLPENDKTGILGEPQVSLDQAVRWAKTKGADERFVNIASLYWEYGKKTGIRPEVLYAQAAKETNYGKYTGNVIPSQNNWAGIKTVTASGDATYDHETFESAEDGVRGHFNHMCAYVGLAPIGEPHNRYNSVASAAWAGTVKYVEELGGKWAPDANYGKSIVQNYMIPMANS